jgi:hypothetical protein
LAEGQTAWGLSSFEVEMGRRGGGVERGRRTSGGRKMQLPAEASDG